MGQLHHPGQAEFGAEGRGEQVQQVAGADEGLQAAPVAAAADRAGLVQGDVADLARGAARAPVDLPVDHQARADAAGHLDVGEVAQAPAGAPDQLAEGAEVGVVVDVHRHAEALGQLAAGGDAGPAGQDRGGAQRPGLHVDRAGHAQAHADHLVRTEAGLREQPLDQGLGPVEALRGRDVDVHRGALLGEDPVGEVADRDPQVGVAEIDPHHDARVTAERDAAGAPSAGGGVGHHDGAALLQFSDDVGHRGRRESGPAGDLGLGQRAGHPHRAEDSFQVGPVQRGLRARSVRRHDPPSQGGRGPLRRVSPFNS